MSLGRLLFLARFSSKHVVLSSKEKRRGNSLEIVLGGGTDRCRFGQTVETRLKFSQHVEIQEHEPIFAHHTAIVVLALETYPLKVLIFPFFRLASLGIEASNMVASECAPTGNIKKMVRSSVVGKVLVWDSLWLAKVIRLALKHAGKFSSLRVRNTNRSS